MRDDFDEPGDIGQGIQCCRYDLDLDPPTGSCPNDRGPFHRRDQDQIVRWSPPMRTVEASQ
jgi:hypothetical protein